MSQLTADQLADIQAACEANATDAAEAFQRALDVELTLSVTGSQTIDPASLPADFDGAGLVVLMDVDGAAAALAIAESTGLLPDWYAAPDVTGTSKLNTLAQELGMTLLPEALMPTGFRASRVEAIADALTRGGLTAETASLQLALQPGDGEAVTTHLVFPLPNPTEVLAASETDMSETDQSETVQSEPAHDNERGNATPAAAETSPPRLVATSVDDLPDYTKSLLQIKVPVKVTLAAKRQPLSHILRLNAGTIIQFEKSCDELLELEIGEHRVGRGEAVKVGDKFGIRLTSIVLPDERFNAVRPAANRAAEPAAVGDAGAAGKSASD